MKKNEFTLAIIISVIFHVGLISFLIYYNMASEVPFGDGLISVEIVGGNRGTGSASAKVPSKGVGHLSGGPTVTADKNENGENAGDVKNAGSSGGLGQGSLNGNPILTKIRQKIERAKYYPPEARRQKMEGRPEVTFQINPDGTLASASLKSSCGNNLLDQAALETINRSIPLPYYEKPISIAIKFSIEN